MGTKRNKQGLLSCINGVKGAISLFMAVLMTPFLTIALLLVETGRYNSAVSMLDEALGVSSVSLLANYDEYLHDRWGLMALDQKKDVNSLYMHYLDGNANVLGQTISVNTVKAKGVYDLANMDVLKYQIMEYSKLNVPTTLAMDFLNISEFIGKLEKIANFGNIMDLLSNGIGVVDSGITLVESADKLKECANALDDLQDDYETHYVAFANAVNPIIDKLKRKNTLEGQKAPLDKELTKLKSELTALLEAEKEAQENSNEQSDEKQEESQAVKDKRKEISDKEKEIQPIAREINTLASEIRNLKDAAKGPKDTYAQTLKSISDNMNTYREEMKSCLGAIDGIKNKVISMGKTYQEIETDLAEKKKTLSAARESLKKLEADGYDESDPSYMAGLDYKIALEEEVAELETKKALFDAAEGGAGKMIDDWEGAINDYNDATFGELAKSFEALSNKVSNFNISGITRSTGKITREGYKYASLGGYVKADEIEKYLLEQETSLKESPLKALLNGMNKIYDKLMGISLFYEGDLSSCLDTGYYNTQIGGLPGGPDADSLIIKIIQDIGTIVSSAGGLASNLATFKLLKALKELKTLIESIISLAKNLLQFATDLIKSIGQLFTGYDKWYLSVYAAKNLTCRTDYDGGSRKVAHSTMTEYTVSTGSLPKPDELSLNPFNNLGAMITKLKELMNNTGSDLAFTGAELEYILFGSNSEIANQMYVFIVLYLIRLVSNIPSIMSNPEVQGLAAAATFGYPIVIGLYIILEPLVQTVLLVNGRDQEFLPTSVYLSPTGLPKLVSELVSFCKFTDAEAKELGGSMVEGISKSQGDYDYQKKLAEYEFSETNANLKSLFELDYREYCMILLLLTVEQGTMLARVANVIQTETLHHYQQKDKGFVFNLKKSYTYVCADVNASFGQVMPTLIDSSVFTIDRQNYRGY